MTTREQPPRTAGRSDTGNDLQAQAEASQDRNALTTVALHLERLHALIKAPHPTTVAVAASHGRALASGVVAPFALPLFDNAAVDGFAVRSSETSTAREHSPVRLPFGQVIAAGDTRLRVLAAGTADRIMTGAPVPVGADAVIPFERAVTDAHAVFVSSPVDPLSNVRVTAEEVVSGERILEQGRVLNALHVALLASVGVEHVRVVPRLRVAVVSTGSEIVGRQSEPVRGQIFESNSAMIAAGVTSAGCVVAATTSVPDEVGRFIAELIPIAAEADVVITSGGISAGDHEVVRQALAQEGLHFDQLALRPGKPQGAGLFRGTPVLCFPGNPVAAYASFELFARPLLRTRMGLPADDRPVIELALSHALSVPPGRHHVLFVKNWADRSATVFMGRASHGLSVARVADCIVHVDERGGQWQPGDTITATMLR